MRTRGGGRPSLRCPLLDGATHALDYASYLSAFREPDPPPPDQEDPPTTATTSKEIKYGSKNAGAWPSTAAAHNSKNDDDAIPKVVLRPRTKLKLQQEQQAAAAANKEAAAPVPRSFYKSQSKNGSHSHAGATRNTKGTDAAAPAPAIQNHHASNAAHQRATAAASTGSSTSTRTSSSYTSSSILRDSNTKDTTLIINSSSASALPNKEAEDRRQLERLAEQREEMEFMEWCRTELGIDTVLEIQWFEYDHWYDYAAANHNWEDDIRETTESSSSSTGGDDDSDSAAAADSAASQKISIRGLAAGRDILEGETVIRIPVRALHAVATTIDRDPVLSRILRDWKPTTTSSGEAEDPQFYELPLLAVALLHHRRLGAASPIAPYVRLLMRTPVSEQLPFLWSAARIRRRGSEGVRQVARGIRDEVRGMYEGVVQGWIAEHPDLLGPDAAVDEHGVWMFSYEMFQWAFAIVNSRHWQLPIDDLATTTWNTATTAAGTATTPHAAASVLEDQQVPPASVPTESWVLEHGDVDDDFAGRAPGERQRNTAATSPHSFLAPVADLLNFGPPCTRVQYDAKQHAFEVIATCSFHKGEEVTFWYSNECDDVMMGVYGFSHPLIQPCRTNEEWRLDAADLEEELQGAYDDLELLEGQLDMLEAILADCDCCDEDAGEPKLRHEQRSARRSSKGSNDRQQRIRRTFSRKSEF